VPVDQNVEVATVGGPLERYEVTLPGGRVATMKLNEDDARRYGVLEKPKAEAENSTEADVSSKSRTTTRNKARTASDKGDG
jgi:hypothetical protein